MEIRDRGHLRVLRNSSKWVFGTAYFVFVYQMVHILLYSIEIGLGQRKSLNEINFERGNIPHSSILYTISIRYIK